MLDRVILLLFLSTHCVISHQQRNIDTKCPLFSGKSIFVSTAGKDSETCGSQTNPCRSIAYAVKVAGRQNISSVVINISAGNYQEAESINLECGGRTFQRISFWGARENTQVVKVDFSLKVHFCEVSMVGLHWKNSQPVLHHALMSTINICQCTAKGTNVSITASSSTIVLQENSISRCSGYQLGLPLLSVMSFPGDRSTLQIINCNISDNFGPVVFVGSVHTATIVASNFEGNKVSSDRKIMTAQVSHLKILSTSFVRNSGNLLGLEDNSASASLEKCHFSCNVVNGSFFSSPVTLNSIHQVSCADCTVDSECPVHCSPGQFLSSAILCKPCSVGSYSPGTVLNKTVLQCTSCPAGTYSSKAGSKACAECDEDTFSPKAGSTSCTKCKNDFLTAKPGQSSCSRLTIGFIVLTACVVLLIVVPLLILVIRNSSQSLLKQRCSSSRPLDEVTQKLCEDGRVNYSVQGDGYARNGLA